MPTTFFRVEVDLVAEMAVFNPFDFFLEPSAETFPFSYEPELKVELAPYLRQAPATPLFAEYLARIDRASSRPAASWSSSTSGLQQDIAYLIRMEPGVQTPEQTLKNASGSCRDSAWLLVQLLRHLGLAARFVSGYLIQLKSDVKSLDGPSGTEVDFTDLHAWCEVYLPGAGWIGLDPTSGLFAGEGHIPLACSPEPSSAAPISGALDPCETTFEHHMSVPRIWEAPRVTMPYTEQQWGAIDELGKQVDADLRRMDVRLTQGGEPTFVSVDDREGAEWNTEAMGPTKRVLSDDLMGRLRKKYGRGGLVHYGQGKWYPGEQLPRWSLNLLLARRRRADLARSEPDRRRARRPRRDAREGARVPAPPGERLGVDRRNVLRRRSRTPGTTSGAKRKLPSNVDPLESHLDDPIERERLRRVFEQGLEQPVGYALPLARDERDDRRWRSAPWFLRDERCYPGPGRLAARLSPAARFVALGARRTTCRGSIRPTPATTCRRSRVDEGATTSRRGPRHGTRRTEAGRPPSLAHETPSGTHDVAGEAAAAAVAGQARARRNRPASSSARRCASSRGTAGSTSSCRRRRRCDDYLGARRRDRADGAGDAPAGAYSRATSRPSDPRLGAFTRHARPGRDRGEHPPGAELARAGRADDASLRRGARDAADDARSSCSTAATPAPAAATTSCSAARRRATSPFLRRPDLLASLLGVLAQPSVAVATCSRACSSARRARRRASTRRATIRSTRSRSRSRSCPRRRSEAGKSRRGWSIACCATC